MDAAEERARLVKALQGEGYLRDPRVAEAMLRVPREHFLREERDEAYRDTPLPIGSGQTISAPHMVAMMTEALDLGPGMRVLEVGTGSGYHAAVVAEVLGPSGKVFSVERVPELAERARASLASAGYPAGRVEVVVGDGSLGWPAEAPYDRAYVTCAAPSLPAAILGQLRPDGLLLAPVGDRLLQHLILARVGQGGVETKDLGRCVFVPLVGAHGFPGEA